MPPKTRGRPKKQTNDVATPGLIAANTTSSPSTETRGSRALARVKGKGKAANRNVVPDVYRDMLAEALPSQSEIPERPLKKRKVGPRGTAAPRAGPSTSSPKQPSATESHDHEEDEDIEFEDVFAPQVLDDEELDDDEPGRPQQTAYRDSDEETVESDVDWENINFDNKDDEPSGDLELNLTASSVPQTRPTAPRRKAITQADKVLRLEIHKLHILCLLSHVDRRNEWCNDSAVHDMLKPLLTKKMLSFLRPRQDLSQFSQTDAFKRGLDLAAVMWRTQFEVTKRGMRRALWADDEEHIKNVSF
jgi:xeroderma pigmentosum group C-complementing protein